MTWFREEARDLPWRRTRDPYAIWVSEVMLQQTQVATVIPYWLRWMEQFPTPLDLAQADEQEVLQLWSGLGYYRRARSLHLGAKWVVEHGIPTSAKEWLLVPGVGPYTAAAIASIAFGEPAPLVDGNVERVVSRLLASDNSGAQLHREAWKWADENLVREHPSDWNQALMELGATVCTPKQPKCLFCPVHRFCVAREQSDPDRYPRKVEKRATVQLEMSFGLFLQRDRLALVQLPEGAWWHGLWSCPQVDEPSGELIAQVKHAVTHHRITARLFWDESMTFEGNVRWISWADLSSVPLPSSQQKLLSEAKKRFLGST